MKALFHPLASDEFDAAARYYEEIDSELGDRFYREIQRLVAEACIDPEQFGKFDPPARRHFGNVFPYAVIYLEKPTCVWIVAVMHLKRCPGYWKARMIQ